MTADRTAAPRHLGVVDWGIGGLDLTRRLARVAPTIAVTYWSDTGAPPYGLLAPGALAARLRAVVAALVDEGCDEVVLACNAASTALGALTAGGADPPGVPVHGVIAAGIAQVPDDAEFVGVVGGARTIRSGRHRRGLDRPGRRVRGRIAQPLSAHIEAGRVAGPEFEADLRRIVAPLRGADALILGCTHYPAAADAFAALLPGTTLVDPVDAVAAALADRAGPAALAPVAPRRFRCTGDGAAMVRSARLAWGLDLPHPEPRRLAPDA